MNGTVLVFMRRPGISSPVIRAMTWSPWSHVGLMRHGDVLESTFTHGGVTLRSACASLAGATTRKAVIPGVDLDAVWNSCLKQLGKPYDWTAIVGIGLHRDWAQQDRWFCSELVAWGLVDSGQAIFQPGATRRVTPEHMWMVSKPL